MNTPTMWQIFLRRIGSAAVALPLVVATSIAAEPAAQALPAGGVDFAGRLARDHWHLFGAEHRTELENLNREVREAAQQLDALVDADAKTAALSRGRTAIDRVCEQVRRHSKLIRVDLTSARPTMGVAGPIELPGDTGALLFEVHAGGEGQQFSSVTRDLSELPRGPIATLVIVDVGATGVTHAIAGLEHLPVGRTTLLIEFRRPEQGAVRLPLDVTTPRPGRLKLAVLSDDTGQPVPAMVRLTWRNDGRARPPSNAIDFAPQFDASGKVTSERVAYLPGARKGSFWCAPEPFDMRLSPGVWEIAVGRGFEHTPVFEEVTIRAGETVEKTIQPRRWVKMRERGWWSGDDHVHARLVSEDDARNLMAWALAEDVHVTTLLEVGDVYRKYFEQRGFGPAHRVQEGDYVLVPAQECPRTGNIGHVLTMNITGLVRDPDRYYLYDTALDSIHAQGGLTGYAHAATGMFEVHRDMTLNVPRQKIDFFEILQFNNLGTDLYYEFLNLGCKVTASAGSDLPWGGTIGETRIYSYLGRERFSADAWFDGVRRGRTFTTSGPMIEFTVDDALPGDEIRVTSDRLLRIRARAWDDGNSSTPVRLEIIRHGNIIRATESKDPRRPEAELDFTVNAGEGFWIAARARTGLGTSAHTTPVYVVREGLRFWKFEALDDLFARRLDSLKQIEEIVADARRQDPMRLEANREQKQLAQNGPELLERVAAARDLYAGLQQTAATERSRRGVASSPTRITSDPPGWELVAEQNFPVANQFPQWRREGSGSLSSTKERTVLVETKRGFVGSTETDASTVWFEQPASGDVRIEFDAAAEPGSRASFFFNARPRGQIQSIFDWQRLLARPEDYAGDERLELYALDILRPDEKTVVLRRLGGKESVAAFNELRALPASDAQRRSSGERFDKLTILRQAPSPFGSTDPQRMYHFDVRVVGPRVTVLVDGQVLIGVIDEGRKDRPFAGGYFGFRSSQPGRLWFDNVRMYRPITR